MFRNEAYSAAESTPVGSAVSFFQSALIIFATFRERNWSIEVKILAYEGVVMIIKAGVFYNCRDARYSEIGLPPSEA